MTKLTYSILLHPETNGYSVEIPDINHGSWTQGETIDEFQSMAIDLIQTILSGQPNYPKPTPLNQIKTNSNTIKKIVSVELN